MKTPKDVIAESLGVLSIGGRFDDMLVPDFRDMTYRYAEAILHDLRESGLRVIVSDSFVGQCSQREHVEENAA